MTKNHILPDLHLTPMSEKLQLNQHYIYLYLGLIFFAGYWFWGYDGITFSDDVSYIIFGQKFWEGTPVISGDNFTFRWGAYLLSGLITYLLGLDDHLASLSSFVYYSATLLLIWSILPKRSYKIWFTLFFVTNIYLLHFLPKVYPDSALVFWAALIPYSAFYRHNRPIESALFMALAFFVGFCTKETIIYLAPFPLLLWIFDFRENKPKTFYYYFSGFIVLLVLFYLGYFYWKFDNPFYRFQSIQEGHYISPYSYFDKGWGKMLERLTFVPITTFIERAYWVWIILSVPSLVRAFKTKKELPMIFALASICLILGFWFLTTSLSYYNPLHLNPRHLIILLPFLSVNIALESSRWQGHYFWNRFCALWIVFGGFVAFALLDWKMGCYYFLFGAVLFFLNKSKRFYSIIVLLLIPVIAAVYYQKSLKNYPHFQREFISLLNNCDPQQSPLISHDFVCSSQEIITGKMDLKNRALSFNELQEKAETPGQFTLFLYKYSQHAYPDEADLLVQVSTFASQHHFVQTETLEDPWLKIIRFKKVDPLSPSTYNEYAINVEPDAELLTEAVITAPP